MHAFFAKPPHGPGAHELDDRALEIANRLRFVCGDLPPEELLELAQRMARLELKYRGRVVVDEGP
jgi:hypothetical protein